MMAGQLGDPPVGPATPTKIAGHHGGGLIQPNRKGQPRRGGRVKGTPNKSTMANLAKAIDIMGMSPLEWLLKGWKLNARMTLKLYADLGTKKAKLDDYFRYQAAAREYAASAATYCHPKPIAQRPEGELPAIDINNLTEAQIDILILRLTGRTSDSGGARVIEGSQVRADNGEGT
jgi:hypothetical protein